MTQAFNLSQLANFVNSSGQLDASTGLTNTNSIVFPTGTLMLFQQTAAPTGWTKQTTHNNKALRIVSGTASSGGNVAFTTAFASGLSDGATTLSSAQMPSHTHIPGVVGGGGAFGNAYCNSASDARSINAGETGPALNSTGGGGSHSHSLPDFAVQYVDVIIASKN